jgi:hypothetical protein
MRRRKPLKPETFPFLAVLLCAMGSLILLLLVMDRRAKAVARAKALQTLARTAEDDERANAARQAEWERRCRALHTSLQQQEDEVQQQVRSVQDRMAAAGAQLQAEEGRRGDLRRTLEDEMARLAGGEGELAAGRARVAEAERQTEATRAELAVMNRNLQQLELTLAELKAARKRAGQTYSVVPYRGKRGENHRPLYIECTGAGLVFHPDRQPLAGADFTPSGVRAEIERRIARQRDRLKAAGAPSDKPAYLLFLIRPEGVGSYTLTMAALRGLEVDFGYELIDRDWLLDFPADADPPSAQPWMTAETKPLPAPTPMTGRGPKGYRSGPGETVPVAEGSAGTERPPPTAGVDGGPGAPGGGGLGLAGAGDTGSAPGMTTSRFAPGSAVGSGSSGEAPQLRTAGAPPLPGASAGFGPGSVAGTGNTGGGVGTGITGPPLKAGSGFAPDRAVGTRGAGAVAGFGTPGAPSAAAGPAGVGAGNAPGPGGTRGSGEAGPVGAPAPASSGDLAAGSVPGTGGAGGGTGPRTPVFTPGSAFAPEGTPGETPSGTTGPPAPPGGSPSSASAAPSGTGGTGGGTGPGATAAAPPAGGAAGGSGSAGSGTGAGTRSSPDQGDAAAGPSADNSINLGPSIPTTERRPPPPPRLRLVGNRDWTILVECTADAVVLYPSGKRYLVTALVEDPAAAHALVEMVRGMIARRQAMVRAGEPAYRPQLRFLVRPDGLRTFYQAYPTLEAVQVPMSRHNIDANEEIR